MVKITNSKQRRTLERIFETPAPKDLLWQDVVSLFEHLGYKLYEMSGSRVCFKKKETPSYHVHKPHPSKHIHPKAVTELKNHLKQIGVTP